MSRLQCVYLGSAVSVLHCDGVDTERAGFHHTRTVQIQDKKKREQWSSWAITVLLSKALQPMCVLSRAGISNPGPGGTVSLLVFVPTVPSINSLDQLSNLGYSWNKSQEGH